MRNNEKEQGKDNALEREKIGRKEEEYGHTDRGKQRGKYEKQEKGREIWVCIMYMYMKESENISWIQPAQWKGKMWKKLSIWKNLRNRGKQIKERWEDKWNARKESEKEHDEGERAITGREREREIDRKN